MNKNRAIRLILTAALTLLVAFSCAPLWAQADEVSAEVASLKGSVTVKRAASEKTFNAFVGLKLKQGDVVTTAAGGEITINIGADKTVKALSDSAFKITGLTGTDTDSQVGFTLIKGTVFNEVRSPQSSDEGMTVRTGNSVVGVRGTTYTVSLRGSDGLVVHTLEGSVFLDSVIQRLTNEQNAALVHQQTTVEAGQGANQNGTFELTMADFTQAELEYITQHPDSFPPDMVNEAQNLLDNWVEPTPTPTEGQNQIVYDTAPPSESGGGDGDGVGGGGNQGTAYTITIHFEGGPNFAGYYGRAASFSVAAGSMLVDAFATYTPGKMIHTFDGWCESNTGANGTNAVSGAIYTNDDIQILVNKNYDLWPHFTPDTYQNGSTDPYIIDRYNFPHFAYFVHNNLSANYELYDDINYASYSWPQGWSWQPIGTSNSTYFRGSFDGGGNTISNFSVDTNQNFAGFFGFVSQFGGPAPVIKNLHIKGNISTAVSSGSSELCAGGIAGYISSATISGCTFTGSVTATSTSSSSYEAYAGGIVGRSAGTLLDNQYLGSSSLVQATSSSSVSSAGGIAGHCDSGDLTNCTSVGSVEAVSSSGTPNAGGIAGEFTGSAGNFKQNHYTPASGATVSAASTDPGTGFTTHAGGIAGASNTIIQQCSVTGGSYIISATTNDGAEAGGIAGAANSGVSDCYVQGGNIIGDGGNGTAVGGIAGDASGIINNCYYNGGTVSASGSNASAGGIAGYTLSNIISCAAYSGTVTSTGTVGRICGNPAYVAGMNNYGSTSFLPGSWTTNAVGPDGADETPANMGLSSWWANSANWFTGNEWNSSIWNLNVTLPTLLP